jgi:hypothetical protein
MTAPPAPVAGRMCPVDYRYSASAFNRPAELEAEVLYVVGGLYGNLAALDAIEALAATECTPPAIVLNGDFHWFDAEPTWFATIETRAARHHAIRGNVETEVARAGDIGAGCGCAYPPDVDDGMVTRSNAILRELRDTASALPGVTERLRRLPMHLVARVGGLRIGVVHGDATSLAGWGFAHDALDRRSALPWLDDIHRTSGVDAFASTHTCLAALRDVVLPSGRLTIVNNGAAGMPNFLGTRFGLISRISARPAPRPALYGIVRHNVHIDAIAIDYDTKAFAGAFVSRWPEGSPARASYWRRIVSGPDHAIGAACRAAA